MDRGDQIRVRLDTLEMTVRLHGVDCPSEPPELTLRAKEYVQRRIGNQTVRIEVRGTGPKQTVYGEVFLNTEPSLNLELVRVGLGRWARKFAPKREDIARQERLARQAKRGLWGTTDGSNVPLPEFSEPAKHVLSIPSTKKFPPRKTTVVKVVEKTGPSTGIAAAFVFCLTAALTLGILFFASGRRAHLLPLQALLAGFIGVSTGLLVPFIPSLLWGAIKLEPPLLVCTFSIPLILLAFDTAVRWQRTEQGIRAIPPLNLSDRGANEFVRVSGQSTAPLGVVVSRIGQIPGIYVRERSFRYEREPGHRGRKARYRWTPLAMETHVVDFQLSNDSGAVIVDSTEAEFHCLRIARFYNEIPVDRFFEESYPGDVRTEVFFIPAEANLTVWGRCYPDVLGVSPGITKRIGLDLLRNTLIVVEETPSRLYTRRPIFSLLLMLLSGILSVGTLICLLVPRQVTSWLHQLGIPGC